MQFSFRAFKDFDDETGENCGNLSPKNDVSMK